MDSTRDEARTVRFKDTELTPPDCAVDAPDPRLHTPGYYFDATREANDLETLETTQGYYRQPLDLPQLPIPSEKSRNKLDHLLYIRRNIMDSLTHLSTKRRSLFQSQQNRLNEARRYLHEHDRMRRHCDRLNYNPVDSSSYNSSHSNTRGYQYQYPYQYHTIDDVPRIRSGHDAMNEVESPEFPPPRATSGQSSDSSPSYYRVTRDSWLSPPSFKCDEGKGGFPEFPPASMTNNQHHHGNRVQANNHQHHHGFQAYSNYDERERPHGLQSFRAGSQVQFQDCHKRSENVLERSWPWRRSIDNSQTNSNSNSDLMHYLDAIRASTMPRHRKLDHDIYTASTMPRHRTLDHDTMTNPRKLDHDTYTASTMTHPRTVDHDTLTTSTMPHPRTVDQDAYTASTMTHPRTVDQDAYTASTMTHPRTRDHDTFTDLYGENVDYYTNFEKPDDDIMSEDKNPGNSQQCNRERLLSSESLKLNPNVNPYREGGLRRNSSFHREINTIGSHQPPSPRLSGTGTRDSFDGNSSSMFSSEADSDFLFYPCTSMVDGPPLTSMGHGPPLPSLTPSLHYVSDLMSPSEGACSPSPGRDHGVLGVGETLDDVTRQFYFDDDALSDEVFIDEAHVTHATHGKRGQTHAEIVDDMEAWLQYMNPSRNQDVDWPTDSSLHTDYNNMDAHFNIDEEYSRGNREDKSINEMGSVYPQPINDNLLMTRQEVDNCDSDTTRGHGDALLAKEAAECEEICSELSNVNLNLASAFDTLRRNGTQSKSRRLWKERRSKMKKSPAKQPRPLTPRFDENDLDNPDSNTDKAKSDPCFFTFDERELTPLARDGDSSDAVKKPLRGILKNKTSFEKQPETAVEYDYCSIHRDCETNIELGQSSGELNESNSNNLRNDKESRSKMPIVPEIIISGALPQGDHYNISHPKYASVGVQVDLPEYANSGCPENDDVQNERSDSCAVEALPKAENNWEEEGTEEVGNMLIIPDSKPAPNLKNRDGLENNEPQCDNAIPSNKLKNSLGAKESEQKQQTTETNQRTSTCFEIEDIEDTNGDPNIFSLCTKPEESCAPENNLASKSQCDADQPEHKNAVDTKYPASEEQDHKTAVDAKYPSSEEPDHKTAVDAKYPSSEVLLSKDGHEFHYSLSPTETGTTETVAVRKNSLEVYKWSRSWQRPAKTHAKKSRTYTRRLTKSEDLGREPEVPTESK